MTIRWTGFLLAVFLVGVMPSGCAGANGEADPSDASEVPVTDPAKELEAIRIMLDEWHAAGTSGDENAYFQHLAEDAIYLGPDSKQRWDVNGLRAFTTKHYAGKGFALQVKRRDIVLSNDAEGAWVEEDLHSDYLGTVRGVGWLQRGDDGTWQVFRYSLMIAVPFGSMYKVKGLLDRER